MEPSDESSSLLFSVAKCRHGAISSNTCDSENRFAYVKQFVTASRH